MQPALDLDGLTRLERVGTLLAWTLTMRSGAHTCARYFPSQVVFVSYTVLLSWLNAVKTAVRLDAGCKYARRVPGRPVGAG